MELHELRNCLGRIVRNAWIKWAQTQPNPKPSWLVPYDELPEVDQEADKQIGEAVVNVFFPELEPTLTEMSRRNEAIGPLIASVTLVLSRHGLQNTCEGVTTWAGTPEQQSSLATLHRALCDYLPPLPSQ